MDSRGHELSGIGYLLFENLLLLLGNSSHFLLKSFFGGLSVHELLILILLWLRLLSIKML